MATKMGLSYIVWISRAGQKIKLLKNDVIKPLTLNPIQDGPFRDCSQMGGVGGKKDPLPKFCHTHPTLMKLGTLIPYLKKIRKIYKWCDTPFEFCWHQQFCRNQLILLHQEIQIQILFWCIISNHFNFFWVFKDFFNKDGYNFDDVSKNGYSRPS